ncbi:hypothetical protein ACF0H5_020807 [Mactra antiquata]
MKLCLLFLLGTLVYVYGETCSSATDCDFVNCPESDYNLDCHNGQCTCTHTTATCSSLSDCPSDGCLFGMHCIDGACRCGFNIGGIGK